MVTTFKIGKNRWVGVLLPDLYAAVGQSLRVVFVLLFPAVLGV